MLGLFSLVFLLPRQAGIGYDSARRRCWASEPPKRSNVTGTKRQVPAAPMVVGGQPFVWTLLVSHVASLMFWLAAGPHLPSLLTFQWPLTLLALHWLHAALVALWVITNGCLRPFVNLLVAVLCVVVGSEPLGDGPAGEAYKEASLVKKVPGRWLQTVLGRQVPCRILLPVNCHCRQPMCDAGGCVTLRHAFIIGRPLLPSLDSSSFGHRADPSCFLHAAQLVPVIQ